MEIKLDRDTLSAKLKVKGFSDFDLDNILEVITSGLPITVNDVLLEVDGGSCVSVKLLNRSGEVPESSDELTVYNFIADIHGIEANQIISLEIPKLTYAETNLLTLKVEISPFSYDWLKPKLSLEKV